MSDAPRPIPAEGAWSGDLADLPNWNAMPRRNRRKRRRAPYPLWLKYVAICFALAIVVSGAQIALHAYRADPRDSRVFAERELRLTALRPTERVIASVSVWQRPLIDYFRATRGILVLTDAPPDSAHPVGGRVLYLGLQPRDPLSPPDAPPTFDQREWPIDTLVRISPSRTFFFVARALSLAAPREPRLLVGYPAGASADADALQLAVAKKYATLRAVGWQLRETRRARDRERLTQQHEGRRAWYHTVKRGEALSSVAKLYGATPEQLREWNGMTNDRIRIGQQMLVKPWTRVAAPFPPGIVPERAPELETSAR
ncbi:MAG: LysM peptidoglycan-binding domain-containing protein [Gemmatimonadaceae bacterium]